MEQRVRGLAVARTRGTLVLKRLRHRRQHLNIVLLLLHEQAVLLMQSSAIRFATLHVLLATHLKEEAEVEWRNLHRKILV